MSLSDAKVRALKGGAKAVKHSDGGGLYLLVTTSGGRSWRWNYIFAGKQKTMVYGLYPDVSLLDARERHRVARQLLHRDVDPAAEHKANDAALAKQRKFDVVAREWFDGMKSQWAATHAIKQWQRIETTLLPWLGERSIGDITSPEVLAPIKRIEARGARDTAKRVLRICGQIFRFAVASGYTAHDPTPSLRGALASPDGGHLAALTEPKAVAEYLRAIDAYTGFPVVKAALQLGVLTFVRPGELRHAEWAEFDLDGATWNLPAEKMKGGNAHLVPLARQAVAVLRELRALTGSSRYVFPAARDWSRPMSNGAVLMALRRMGYTSEQMTGHGVRAMARTNLDEVLEQPVHLIEHQLAHVVKDPNRRAYNRTTHTPARVKMMQLWADWLDCQKADNIVQFPRAKSA